MSGWYGEGGTGWGSKLGGLARSYAQQYGYTPGAGGGTIDYMQLASKVAGQGGGDQQDGGGGGMLGGIMGGGKGGGGGGMMGGMSMPNAAEQSDKIGSFVNMLAGGAKGRGWAQMILANRQLGMSNERIPWA
jgi:hypothetical protein